MIVKGRCSVNPLSRVSQCVGDEGMVYTADVAAIMIHYKIADNISDSGLVGRIGWKILNQWTKSSWKKAAKREPEADEIVAEMIRHQQRIEAELSPSVDAACEPTAEALSKLAGRFSYTDESRREPLKHLAYLVGRFIYLCDATEDLEKDHKTGNYNPFLVRYKEPKCVEDSFDEIRVQAVQALYMTIGQLGRVTEQMEFNCFAPIINNIIEFGLRNSVDLIVQGEGGLADENSL